MSRFNPETYPERLAVDAYARLLRSKEIDRIVREARARVDGWLRRGGVAARGGISLQRARPSH
jgi:hypothetical protein